MNMPDNLNTQLNHIKKINYKAKIMRESQALKQLRSNIKYCNKNIKREYRTMGKHYADCLLDEEAYLQNVDVDMSLSLVLSNQKAIDASMELIQVFEESLTRNMMIQEKVEFEIGFERTKSMLQEQLSRGEISELDCEYESFYAKRWFDNYDKITDIRMKKLENKISWEEMNAEIMNLLKVHFF